jgi:hypothetical protein
MVFSVSFRRGILGFRALFVKSGTFSGFPGQLDALLYYSSVYVISK